MSVLVVLEGRAGKWNRQSFEALAAGQQIAQALGLTTQAVVIGSSLDGAAAEACTYDLEKVIVIDNPALAEYTPDGYTAALEQLAKSTNPKAIVFPHTYQVRDYGPKLATRLGQAFISDVVNLKTGGDHITFVRQLFGGKVNADINGGGELLFLSVQAGAFQAAQPGAESHPIEKMDVQLDPLHIRSKPGAPFREAQRSVDLGAAEMIVSVGRGIKDKDNLKLVQDLADCLGAELAASRPICDNGWLPMDRQVGSSGQTVSPRAYIAVGISGAIQHLVGMKGSKTIIAINKDENAPIFEAADYGVVGDLFDVVPALIEEIKKVKA